jgi:membrane-associated phospholipid phosphatase
MANVNQQDTNVPPSSEDPDPLGIPLTQGHAGDPNAPYRLLGPQVEPTSAFWASGPKYIHVVEIEKLKSTYTDNEASPFYVKAFPREGLNDEIQELKWLASNRHLPGALVGDKPLRNRISDLIHLQKYPFGAIVNARRPQWALTRDVTMQDRRIFTLEKVVLKRGGELARLFEIETPGLYHRHALNWLLYNRPDISPVRQARIWMALDVAIYSALIAAWHYKWVVDRTKFRQRPYEYDSSLNVLFDSVPADDGTYVTNPPDARQCPQPTPGTPRHPAYPSGHSTFSAAASSILEYFFSPTTFDELDDDVVYTAAAAAAKHYKIEDFVRTSIYAAAELRRLASNIGEARLWGGVHWRSDHSAGQLIGRAVARCVAEQLRDDCIPPVSKKSCELAANDTPQEPTARPPCSADQDDIPPRLVAPTLKDFGVF